jgi:inositol phosphorylceramide mannosyltransferase catalytic subunit
MQTRARVFLILIPLLISLVYVGARVVAFVHLFFEHAGIAITQDQIRDTYDGYRVTGGIDPRPEYIPRHIHQVWHDWSRPGGNASVDDIPADWDEVRGTCRELMPDWEYTVSFCVLLLLLMFVISSWNGEGLAGTEDLRKERVY